ncbi:uncharacterized protein G2W53_041857 [Senna tora]|uniref:Uncharacterized protein n=1 Tax=Senna tora TaxID=362788 RepID=A0A834W1U4_9FABA|nr:uncharacterized protein G2W53_041857 [Senna tora]
MDPSRINVDATISRLPEKIPLNCVLEIEMRSWPKLSVKMKQATELKMLRA